MIDTERSILAIAIQYPEHMETVLANCDDGFFKWVENQKIYETIKDLHEGKSLADWETIIDLLKGEINASWFVAMQDTLRGTYPMGIESLLLEKIKLVKEDKAKRAILSEIQKELQGHMPDFDRLSELVNRGKVIKLIQEEADFQTAYDAYLQWKERRPTNIVTGFPTFDRLTDNFDYGELVSVMGRTTTAKTWTALNILNRLIPHVDAKIGFFSMEMAKSALIERMMQLEFGLSRYDVHKERISGRLDEKEFIDTYRDLNVYGRVYSVKEVERLVDRDGLKIIFLDYLQLMKMGEGKSIYEKTTYRMQETKEMAKNKGVMVFLMVQLSRKAEGGWVPVTIDMARESGTIEESSDFIIGTWDPSLQEGASAKHEGKLRMRLLKNKRGPTIGITCSFSKVSGKLCELEIERKRGGPTSGILKKGA